ncbi:acyltransferase family protein [Pseudolysinimonas kribbensis]|uniref:Acyltransferase n=1 Tax=Pseudolysinimonas kribbensis TaxID=433641 RepID=A0ABQ6K3W2_9MICO|nr:acyltransferase family protein [Pseudolysinimonas kribbensis]GMA94248.1 acyltransferase [Pseudolysinimonas kribbensis]
MTATQAATTERPAAARPRPREKTLLEVQALRALAVLLVVAYHLWPGRIGGGFIGVDVFFVISGFLITAHLLREYQRDGRIRITAFWGRRIRRLLPAAFLVLAACVVAAFTVLPAVVREQTLRQVAGASVYVLNWLLGFDSVDYLAQNNQATVVQHYWTLSVEEQFYVLWPILLILAGLLLTRVFRVRVRPATWFGVLAFAVVIASLAYSIYFTFVTPAFAYFSTFTRAWEFAAGACLAALVARRPEALHRLRATPVIGSGLLTVVGGLVILVSAFVLNGQMPFPGWLAAIPVVGTLFVITGGMPRWRPVAGVVAWRPTQFVGDISYSLYLWHWPIVTALVLVLGRRPHWYEGLVILAASLVLATLSKYLVEDPVRLSRRFSRRVLPAFVFAVCGGLLFGSVVVGDRVVSAQQLVAHQAVITHEVNDGSGCFGANALLGDGHCANTFKLTPSVDLNAASKDLDTAHWCLTWYDKDWSSCVFGDPKATKGTMAVVGDSHAAAMISALSDYYAQKGWKIVSYTRFGCPGLFQTIPAVEGPTLEDQQQYSCRVWTKRVRDELASRTDITKVLFLNFTSGYLVPQQHYSLTTNDVVETWKQILAEGKSVYVIKDWPRTVGESIPVCLASHVGETAPCSVPRSQGIVPTPEDAALQQLGSAVKSVDMSDAFCDAARCYSVIGGVVVYADVNHISGTYARTIMPYLGKRLGIS